MFSFFKSKKPSPDHTPVEHIPGPIPPAPKEDDFIFVERKGGSTPSPSNSGGALNDSSPSRGGSLYPNIPVAGVPAAAPVHQRQQSEEKAGHHVLHGVPFKLSPELAKDSSHWEVTQYHANETLSFITKSAAVRVEYDFSLERGVLYDG